ncbi:helix-turn-helix domain-containing protein [Modestobacter sp. VKM Ac-2985]|uniref:helix-turn-helix domain-containing protein n=1 Tax=Modestobacter sp. VKM Ac-2985 TaxID=3004139 RepID=UPI0022AB9A85|nr:helix-turn-helix transcriptional regulator [Modestobacter sp. VKM Ac-2985]MCZ2836160.1 helix-turn-helix transcriptional regulator [Modestobacter sp. VKM Ac-2985]
MTDDVPGEPVPGTGSPGTGVLADGAPLPVGSLLRRIRRTADLSQRELAGALGVAASTVAQVETGARDLPAGVLARAATLAGLRLGLLDASGREVPGMTPDAVRDGRGRLFPAHLDVRHGDEGWWHGEERYSRTPPWYTFDRGRRLRDRFRAATGTPADHQLPRPGDSLDDRARARRRAAVARQRERERERRVLRGTEQRSLGLPVLTCSCPAACDELLFGDAALSAEGRAVPHVVDCRCRCDIA